MGQPAWPGIRTLLRPQMVASTVALTAVMLLAGCGGSDEPTAGSAPAAEKVAWTLVLDYEPNAVHAGLLRAEQAGYFDDAGIDLDIVAPSSTSDALTQVTRGKADVGLADLIDVARRNERALKDAPDGAAEADGQKVVSLAGAIVQRPLSGLIVDADGPIDRPEQLAGKKIAVSGLPSDIAVVDAIVRKDGKTLPTKPITLGFNGLKALDAGRVDATTAYWPADEVTLAQLGTSARTFALDAFGGPTYPGLVAFTSLRRREADPEHVAAFGEALAHGTRDVIADQAVGLKAVQGAYPELDAGITERQLQRYEPLFGSAATAGKIATPALEDFAEFAEASGLTEQRLTPTQLAQIPPETATP